MLYTWSYRVQFLLERQGKIVTCNGMTWIKSDMGTASNTLFDQKIPEGFRPRQGGVIHAIGNNQQHFEIIIAADGAMRVNSATGATKNYLFYYSGCWIAD